LAVLSLFAAPSAPTMISGVERPVLAQTERTGASFPLPTTVASGTVVQLNGSSSMKQMNEALTQRFKAQFAGTDIKVAYDGTDTALKALMDGTVDLAAIGRPLTQPEKAQGLVEVPLTRHKIALIVAADSPFTGNLTIDQFAQIFRGEITDWSKVGGSPGAIRLIDRPETSDTRQNFQRYPVFQTAPFEAGATAAKVPDDSTDAVINALGRDGIGYAIADQVINNPKVRVVSMHNVEPTDPRYPFSQPLLYVYKGPDPSPAAKAFLGHATAAENQQVIEEARIASAQVTAATEGAAPSGTMASPNVAVAPETGGIAATATEATGGGFPWWLLPLAGLPLLGGLLWWLAKDRGSPVGGAATTPPLAAPPRTSASPAPVAPPAVPVRSTPDARIILTPRSCTEAYAYWEIPREVKANLQSSDQTLKLRLSDVTDINLEHQSPHNVREFDCSHLEADRHISITVDDRDYIAEIGYLTEDGRWSKIARSPAVRVPACEPRPSTNNSGMVATVAGATAAVGAGAAAVGMATHSVLNRSGQVAAEPTSRVVLVPRSPDQAYAYWEVPEQHHLDLKQQGGRKLALRVADTTGIDLDQQSAHRLQQYDCNDQSPDLHISIPQSDRDYVAELGYVTQDDRWLRIARSASVHVPAKTAMSQVEPPRNPTPTAPNVAGRAGDAAQATATAAKDTLKNVTNVGGNVTQTLGTAIAGGAAAVAGASAAVSKTFDQGRSWTVDRSSDSGSASRAPKQICQIILVPRSAQDAYAYWEVSDDYKLTARQQGGQTLMLRVHDATNIDIDYQPPHGTQEFPCDELDLDQHVPIPVNNRDYIAELGYYTRDRRWIRIIRSFHVHVPSD
jgi:phosphate transport system substrate-binding protein